MFKITLFENLILEKDNLKGGQMKIGHISENSAIINLIHEHNLHNTHQETLQKAQDELKKHKEEHLFSDDADDREEHGRLISTAISNHIKEVYPGFNVERIHHSNYSSIAKITGNKHEDSRQKNPSDIVLKLHNPTTGESVYHGYSLKSTQKKGGHIGFKNPSPKSMDKFFGTKREEMHKAALDELFERFPNLKYLPNKSKDENSLSKKKAIQSSPEIVTAVKEISSKHFKNIAKHTADTLNTHLNETPDGHERLKNYIKSQYMNSSVSMPYAKITASGTKKTGMQTELEDVQNSRVTRLLNHPKSKMRVNHSGNYIKYDIHDPDTNTWHGVANEQVKTSSGFGYSCARHNIHPPSENIEQ